nr:anoctamin-1-like [Dermacentor andersoni]
MIHTSLRESGDSQRKGIYNLLSIGAYLGAYPLHDGPFGKGRYNKATETYSERRVLYAEWGRARCWYKEQPLFLIRRYFGEKVGLYFAWVGFYTTMLILPSFVGIFTSLYGIAYMLTNKPTCVRGPAAGSMQSASTILID